MALNLMIVTGGRMPSGGTPNGIFSAKTKMNSDEDVWLSVFLYVK
jgi:hypothetical protein